ncbi:MAG: Gfo/Idh/MocA family protein [Bryobacteraceae bacterium]
MSAPQVALIGGGMIAHDQILPSLYHLQRQGVIGEIGVCGQHGRTLKALADSPTIRAAFPGQSFRAYPDWSEDPDAVHPGLFKQVLAGMPPRNIAIIALPDQLHFEAVMTALRADQHVICVKPLVLKASEAQVIEEESCRRGLLVGVEYHKRFDDRSHMARRRYRDGLFGEFRLGTACLLEKWYYRHSNFQNWCTTENSDAFTYIGCHYVDLVHFITGLLPVAVSVYGVRDRYPNGNEGFLWTDARVVWNNGACLNVQNALGFPDEAPGTNTQGITMYCAGKENGALLKHSDQYRGMEYCYTRRPAGEGATIYAEPSPDYFQYIDLGGGGLTPVGYGYRSIEFLVKSCVAVESAGAGLSEAEAVERRRARIREFDADGVIATPANSRYNELVVEAGRLSILNGGREVAITYEPEPSVRL